MKLNREVFSLTCQVYWVHNKHGQWFSPLISRCISHQMLLRAHLPRNNTRPPLFTPHSCRIIQKQTHFAFQWRLPKYWQMDMTFPLFNESQECWLMNLKWRCESVRVCLCDRGGPTREERCVRINRRYAGQLWLSRLTQLSLSPQGSASDALGVLTCYIYLPSG